MVLGALAYRSAKKRWLGEVASTFSRRLAEGLAMLVIVAMVVLHNNIRYFVATDPIPYAVIPVLSFVAYAWVAFRAPQGAPALGRPS
jgi:hypothetical protein